MKSITINTKEALVIEVPERAKVPVQLHGFKENDNLLYYYPDGYVSNLKLPTGNWSILGEINKQGEVSFDCEPYVKKSTFFVDDSQGGLAEMEAYVNYINDDKEFHINSDESLITLLNSQGIKLEDLKESKYLILLKVE